ncbi:hypothetical protein ALC56_15332 [Trachymyrmex septentrionalis]|uniref:Uncharacterized protein n=1 Tax=Trachymyrmex septentrionalis TaxID=34720 RepID=A0A151JSN0_9HYME|nr:hypothetical protein ALC56_15332 [Trachymyrmex septentrionalis]
MGAIFRILTKFKKLGEAKMTRAITRQRLATLKETFARCQKLDCKIMLAADEKSKAIHTYFTQSYFLTYEDYYHEVADYMAQVLNCHEVRETRPAVHDVSGLNNSFWSSSHLPRINLPTFNETNGKAFAINLNR